MDDSTGMRVCRWSGGRGARHGLGSDDGRQEFPPESFFKVYCDVDPGFPQPPVYSGTGSELLQEGIFTFNRAYLLDEQAYYWYVRITSLMSGLSTDSEARAGK